MVTVNLVNLHHPAVTHFFFVMRTCKSTLFNFQIYNRVLLTLVTMLYISSPGLTYFISASLYLWIPFTHFAHLF